MDIESSLDHLVPEVVDILDELVVEGIALFQHLEGLEGCADDHRRKRIREEVRTALLTEDLDDLLAAGRESADCAAECLSAGTGEDIDTAIAAELLGDTVSSRTYDACGMAFIDHYESIILLGEIADLVHGSDISVHGEYAVGADDAEPLLLGLLEAAFEVCHVCVGIAVTLCLAEANAIDDGRMVKGIGDDRILVGQECSEETAVGIEACSIEDSVLRVEILGDCLLELLVDVLRSADEADRRHTVAATVHHLLGSLDQPGRIGKSEIVVGTEVQRLASVLKSNFGRLRGSDVAFVLVEPCLPDLREFFLQVFLDFSVHDGNYELLFGFV